MTCTNYGSGLIVCGPPSGVYKRATFPCPECGDGQQDRRAIIRWDGAWYGTTTYCECGDYWQDGWRAPRPFARYWRRDAQREFERMWEHAAPSDLWEAYTRADVEMAVEDDWKPAAKRRERALQAIRSFAESQATP